MTRVAPCRFKLSAVVQFSYRQRKSLAAIGLFAVMVALLLGGTQRVAAGSIVAGETRITSEDP